MLVTFTGDKFSQNLTTAHCMFATLFLLSLFASFSDREVGDDDIVWIITKTSILLPCPFSLFFPHVLTAFTVDSVILLSGVAILR